MISPPPLLLAPALRGASLLSGLPDGPRRAALLQAFRLRLSPEEAAAERAINRVRRRLAASALSVAVEDFGAGSRPGNVGEAAKPPQRRIADIYGRAAAPPAWGRLLFGLVRRLRPASVLELGTSLGVGAMHLQTALALNSLSRSAGALNSLSRSDRVLNSLSRSGGVLEASPGAVPGRLVTLEGAPTLAALAEQHLAEVPAAAATIIVEGRFDDTLGGVAAAHSPFDFVVVDGHHEAAAALRYVGRLRPHLTPGALVILDDAEPWAAIRPAFRALAAEPGVQSVDLVKLGLLFFDAPS